MKGNIFFLILVACLCIVLLAGSLNLYEVANAAPIFSDGFESGTLNAWTVFYGVLSINSQTVYSGLYSAQSKITGQYGNLYYHALSSTPTTIYFSEYVYINSTTYPSTSGDYFQVGGFSSTLGADYGNGGIFVFNSGGTLYWGLYYRNGGNFSQAISSSAVTTGWSYVEMEYVVNTLYSSNGEEHLWLNGVDIKDVIGLYDSDRTLANAVIGGAQSVANPNDKWNYYIDDVTVDSSYIGPTTPNPTPPPTPTPVPTPTPTPTPVATPTPTPTPAPTPTPTPTATSNPASATPSYSPSPGSTASPTPTPIRTALPVSLPTPTATSIPTSTATNKTSTPGSVMSKVAVYEILGATVVVVIAVVVLITRVMKKVQKRKN